MEGKRAERASFEVAAKGEMQSEKRLPILTQCLSFFVK